MKDLRGGSLPAMAGDGHRQFPLDTVFGWIPGNALQAALDSKDMTRADRVILV